MSLLLRITAFICAALPAVLAAQAPALDNSTRRMLPRFTGVSIDSLISSASRYAPKGPLEDTSAYLARLGGDDLTLEVAKLPTQRGDEPVWVTFPRPCQSPFKEWA